MRVEREGAVDLIHSALDATQQTSWSGLPKPLSVRAEYAVVTVDDQGVQRAMLVGGGQIEYGDFRLEAADPPRGKVLSVDPGANTITIDAALPAVDPFIDRVIVIGNEKGGEPTVVDASCETAACEAARERCGEIDRAEDEHAGRWGVDVDQEGESVGAGRGVPADPGAGGHPSGSSRRSRPSKTAISVTPAAVSHSTARSYSWPSCSGTWASLESATGRPASRQSSRNPRAG